MVADTVLFCHTKKFKKTGQGYLCVVSKGEGRSPGDTRWNDLLTDDELVVARGLLRKSNMHVYIYKMNILVDLGCWIMPEVIIFKWAKWTHLTLSSYPKMSHVIEMKGVPILGYPPCDSLWQICHIVNTSNRYIYFIFMLFFHITHSLFYCH